MLRIIKITKYNQLSWFKLGIAIIFLISLFLRFWHLSQFNKLVFDEVYYAKFANYYLIGKEFFNSHPPLSQYIIAFGMWLGSYFPASPDTINDLTGSLRSTFSYRWINALTGAFIPLVLGALAYHLTNRRSYGLIVALLAASDGLFLVESRYALNNIYLVIFGLLGQLFVIFYLKSSENKLSLNLTIAGIFFGASASVKWNGLGFLLGIYLTCIADYLIIIVTQNKDIIISQKDANTEGNPLGNLRKITLGHLVIYLGFIPLAVYILLWIPHLLMNPSYGGFWEVQQKILSFHESIGNGENVHPYCSRWYSWLILWRPIAYFYDSINQPNGKSIVYAVYALGNPILWWFSTIAIFLFCLLINSRLLLVIKYQKNITLPCYLGIFLLANYGANLLPWVKISRCTFIYHYMSSYCFAMLAFAWLLDNLITSGSKTDKKWGIIFLILIIIAFIFWLPIYLGLPLSSFGFRIRMLFPNWV